MQSSDNTNKGNVGESASGGKPSRSKQLRNAIRLQKFNNNRAAEAVAQNPNNWVVITDADEVQQRGHDEVNNKAAYRRPRNQRTKDQRPAKMLDEKPSTVPSKARDEPLYDGEATGSHATTQINSQNLDFSGFIPLVQVVYEHMLQDDMRLRRSMPFCAFQHYCTELLNAVAIHQAIVDGNNGFADEQDPFDVIDMQSLNIPEPVHEHLRGICRIALQNGDRVHYNLPAGGTPQHPDEESDLESGSFGIINADTHNAYESYVSPLVTRRLVERTIEANTPGGAGFEAWHPLPEAARPNGAVCTPNLLGYHIPERLQGEGLNAIANLSFADSADMHGRLSHSPELMARVSDFLNSKSDKFKMVKGFSPNTSNPSAVVVASVLDATANTVRLADKPPYSYGPEAFGSAVSNKSKYFQYKRERRANARGFAMVTAAGAAINGWGATSNNNFTMAGVFTPTVGADYPALRTDRFHENSLSGSVSNSIRNWLTRFYKIKRQ